MMILLYSCHKDGVPCDCKPENLKATMSVFAKGLNNPRGLKFGPDGYLYVAEGGIGGKNTTTTCMQVPDAGPYTGSDTGSRISRIDRAGNRMTFVTNLPSSATSAAIGGFVSGVADIAFIGHTMYGLLTGAGCSHGVPNIPNGVFKVNNDRSWTMMANLSSYYMANPVVHPNPEDFEPDGTPYSMIDVDDNLFVVEPNHGELDKVSQKGKISRIIDISASQGHIVPTCVVFHEGNFYVGNLSVFPIANKSSIYKITPGGQISVVATGFSTIQGIVFDKLGGLYILEATVGHPFPTPNSGDIVRLDRYGNRTQVIGGLNLPTAITIGPDNNIYVSNVGYGPEAIGGGQVVKIGVTCANAVSASKE